MKTPEFLHVPGDAVRSPDGRKLYVRKLTYAQNLGIFFVDLAVDMQTDQILCSLSDYSVSPWIDEEPLSKDEYRKKHYPFPWKMHSAGEFVLLVAANNENVAELGPLQTEESYKRAQELFEWIAATCSESYHG